MNTRKIAVATLAAATSMLWGACAPTTGGGGGSTTTTTNTTTTQHLLPVALASAAGTTGSVPLSVAFDGSSSYARTGTLLEYRWSFGDGSVASGDQSGGAASMRGRLSRHVLSSRTTLNPA